MSSPLNQQVFQIPKLGQLGMQLDERAEQKRAARQAAVDKQIQATGADKAYNETINGLVGDWKGVVDDQYDIFRETAIQYEMSQSESDRAKMQQQAGILNYLLEAGDTILSTAGENLAKAKAENFEGYSVTGEQGGQGYKNFVYQKINHKKTPNGVVIQYGDTWVPAQNSFHFSSELTDQNTFIVPKAIKTGEFANTVKFVDKWQGIIKNSASEAEAVSRINKEIDLALKNESFVQDVHINYGINARGIGSYDKFSGSDYSEIMSSMDDEEINQQAIEYYKEGVRQDVAARFFKPKETDADKGIKATYDVRVISGESITADRVQLEGQAPSTAADGDRLSSITFDLYTGFPSGVSTAYRAEPKELPGGANVAKIVGMGIVDGVPYAEKETYAVRDISGEVMASLEGLDPKEIVIEPLSRADFTRLKGDARTAIITRFKEQGFDLEDWLSGKSVSSQEGNTGKSSTEDKLRLELKSQGFSDAEIESIVTGN